MVYKSLEDYSFCILIALELIKPYEHIMNLYAILFLNKSLFYWTIFSLYLQGFVYGSIVWTIISELP